MSNDTIEGAQLAFNIAPYILKKINNKKIPLMTTLLKAIYKNRKIALSEMKKEDLFEKLGLS